MLLYSIPRAHPPVSSANFEWPFRTEGEPEDCPIGSELGEVAGSWVAAWLGLDLTCSSWREGISLVPDYLSSESGGDSKFSHGDTEARVNGLRPDEESGEIGVGP